MLYFSIWTIVCDVTTVIARPIKMFGSKILRLFVNPRANNKALLSPIFVSFHCPNCFNVIVVPYGLLVWFCCSAPTINLLHILEEISSKHRTSPFLENSQAKKKFI
jgi:hypothetical protein